MIARVGGLVAVLFLVVATASAAPQADEWTLAFSAPNNVVVGGDYTITATVTYTYATNNDVNLVVQLPPAASAIVKSYDSAHCTDPAAGPSRCAFPALSGSATVTFTLTAQADIGADLQSFASTSNSGSPPNPPPNAQTDTTVVPAMTISASASATQLSPGGTVTFSVSATNIGTVPVADVWVSNMLGVDWTSESMSQTGGPPLACSQPNTFDTNCYTASFPAGATATFTASATAPPTVALGEILISRFLIFLGPSPSGTSYRPAIVGIQIVAPAATTTAPAPPPPPPSPTTTTAVPPPPTTTVAPPPATTTASTMTTTTTTITPTQPPPHICRVPALAGMTVANARAALTAAHCRLGVTYAYNRRVRRGHIVRQSSPQGAALPGGSVVRIVVSRGRRR